MDILLVILAIAAAVGLVMGVVWVARRALAAGLIMAARAKASGNPLPIRILGFLAFGVLLVVYGLSIFIVEAFREFLKEDPKSISEDDNYWKMYGQLPEHEWINRIGKHGPHVGYPIDS